MRIVTAFAMFLTFSLIVGAADAPYFGTVEVRSRKKRLGKQPCFYANG